MTKKGCLPLSMTKKEAEILGRLVAQRAKRLPLGHTPLRWLPAAGDKLLKAAHRSRDGKVITLWTLTRDEARSLFHWGACFFHPQINQAELTAAESNAVKSVLQKIASGLMAKTGPERLPSADAEYVVEAFDQRESLPSNINIPDGSQVRKLRRRIDRTNDLLSRKLNEIPVYLQSLIINKYR